MELTEIGSLIQHYKGGKYMVINIGTHSETLDEMLIYQNIADNKVWVRPINMFYEDVEYKGNFVPRFKVIQCVCGERAVDYFEDYLEQYRFKCVKHAKEARKDPENEQD